MCNYTNILKKKTTFCGILRLSINYTNKSSWQEVWLTDDEKAVYPSSFLFIGTCSPTLSYNCLSAPHWVSSGGFNRQKDCFVGFLNFIWGQAINYSSEKFSSTQKGLNHKQEFYKFFNTTSNENINTFTPSPRILSKYRSVQLIQVKSML